MKRTFMLFRGLTTVALATLSLSSAVRGDQLVVDGLPPAPPANTGTQIGSYQLNAAGTSITSGPVDLSSVTSGTSIMGMVFDFASGTPVLLAAAEGDNKILAYSSTGAVLTPFASVSAPVAIAIDSGGDVYVANGGATVEEYAPESTYTGNETGTAVITTGITGLEAQALAVDGSGEPVYCRQQCGKRL